MAEKQPFGPGFHHIALRVRDFEAAVKFYEDGLGCVRRYGWGEGDSAAALMDVGDGNYIEIFAGGKRAPGEDPPEGVLLHYALRTGDVDAAYSRAMNAGARSQMEPKSVPINGDRPLTFRIAFVKGPDGEVIEFFQNEEL